jgi:8-oxo-dGTP pyrophosphatase MutT (NUDIX family)
MPMTNDLRSFLATRLAARKEFVTWGAGAEALPLQVAGYLDTAPPPLGYVSSVRGVVLRGAEVVVFADEDGTPRVLPGGRCEPGETLQETLRRELLEETGWTLGTSAPLGFLHFRHLAPRRPGYAYPYPDFLQVVYAAEAVAWRAEALVADPYVTRTRLLPAAEARQMPLPPLDRLFLTAALRGRGRQTRGRPR